MTTINVNSADLHELLDHTLLAMPIIDDTEGAKYSLACVHLEVNGDTLIAVATDGRFLATHTVASGYREGTTLTLSIPSAMALHLVDQLDGVDGPVSISSMPQQIKATWQDDNGEQCLSEDPPGNRFPKWRDIFPKTEPSGEPILICDTGRLAKWFEKINWFSPTTIQPYGKGHPVLCTSDNSQLLFMPYQEPEDMIETQTQEGTK